MDPYIMSPPSADVDSLFSAMRSYFGGVPKNVALVDRDAPLESGTSTHFQHLPTTHLASSSFKRFSLEVKGH